MINFRRKLWRRSLENAPHGICRKIQKNELHQEFLNKPQEEQQNAEKKFAVMFEGISSKASVSKVSHSEAWKHLT